MQFDTYGRIPDVLKRLDTVVPVILPDQHLEIMPNIRKLISHYTRENNWDRIVVTVTKGAPREKLDAFLDAEETPHIGQIIIDPTAATPDHSAFESLKMAKVRKARLAELGKERNDILFILYGVKDVDAVTSRKFLQHRLQIIEGMLKMDEAEPQLGSAPIAVKNNVQPLKLGVKKALQRLKAAGKHVDTTVTLGTVGDTDPDLSQEVFHLLVQARLLMDGVEDTEMQTRLANVYQLLFTVPDEFRESGVSFDQHKRVVRDLMGAERADQAELQYEAAMAEKLEHVTPPDVRDLNGDGKVDARNKYAQDPDGPSPRPK